MEKYGVWNLPTLFLQKAFVLLELSLAVAKKYYIILVE